MDTTKLLAAAGTVLTLLVTGTPAVSRANVLPGYDAVLYELTENMRLVGGNTVRQAVAELGGEANVGTAICPPSLKESPCILNGTGADNVDLSTGLGPFSGDFTVVVQGDNPVDGAELVVVTGHIAGTIDLSQPVLKNIPLGSVSGTWTANGASGSVHGRFTGVVRLPFIGPGGAPAYLLDDGSTTPVTADDEALGVPTVRIDIKFP